MTSNRQIEANRGNAKRSTGPKTEAGKTRSSRNALRHGLSRPMTSGSDCEIRAMAHEGITEGPDLVRAKLELTRIRSARGALLAAFLNDPHPKLAKSLCGIDAMNAKRSQGRDGCCARVRSRRKCPKARQPSPDLPKNGETGSPAGPATAHSGHVDSIQPCGPLTQGGHPERHSHIRRATYI